MATVKITGFPSLDNIRCSVTCPECDKSFTMKMVKPIMRKNCPGCNRLTYIFTIIFTIVPVIGYVSISVLTIGSNFIPTPYDLSVADVEVTYD